MTPYLKYYLRVITEAEKNAPIVAPSRKAWEMLLGYEPSKVNPDYDDFVATYITRATERQEKLRQGKYTVEQVAVGDDETIITRTEQTPNFARWV